MAKKRGEKQEPKVGDEHIFRLLRRGDEKGDNNGQQRKLDVGRRRGDEEVK